MLGPCLVPVGMNRDLRGRECTRTQQPGRFSHRSCGNVFGDLFGSVQMLQLSRYALNGAYLDLKDFLRLASLPFALRVRKGYRTQLASGADIVRC